MFPFNLSGGHRIDSRGTWLTGRLFLQLGQRRSVTWFWLLKHSESLLGVFSDSRKYHRDHEAELLYICRVGKNGGSCIEGYH